MQLKFPRKTSKYGQRFFDKTTWCGLKWVYLRKVGGLLVFSGQKVLKNAMKWDKRFTHIQADITVYLGMIQASVEGAAG